jgi:glycosyltransferase involved in cell wall biosynthesis
MLTQSGINSGTACSVEAMTPMPPTKPLRILNVLNVDWNRHLGAARVYFELAEQWQAAGHTVEHFAFSEAFPKGHRSSREHAIQRVLFPRKAASFVRQNAGRFDVIDFLVGSLSGSKKALGFDGLLVARSVASPRLYDRFERSVPKRWPGHDNGTLGGRLFYGAVDRWLMRISDAAMRDADLINVANQEEAEFLKDFFNGSSPIIVEPYGLTSPNHQALISRAASASERLQQKRIAFLGMWGPRKGSRIWGEIVRRIRERMPDAQFSFLGTMVPGEAVLRDVGPESAAAVDTVAEFSPDQLPDLLSNCTVGAFPSYVEAFGLAVLEQLAAGIPTVAFDQGGPRDILRTSLPELLVPTGDVEAFANALVRILNLPLADYENLARRSIETARRYSWSAIAQNTIERYRSALTCKHGDC